jgi:hypothetical protein
VDGDLLFSEDTDEEFNADVIRGRCGTPGKPDKSKDGEKRGPPER